MKAKLPERYVLCVAGSRTFLNWRRVFAELDKRKDRIAVVVHGDCELGPDRYAGSWCKSRGVECWPTPAKWEKLGRRAGPVRNAAMAVGADCLLAFWDGKSRGTKNCMEEFAKRGKPVVVVTGVAVHVFPKP